MDTQDRIRQRIAELDHDIELKTAMRKELESFLADQPVQAPTAATPLVGLSTAEAIRALFRDHPEGMSVPEATDILEKVIRSKSQNRRSMIRNMLLQMEKRGEFVKTKRGGKAFLKAK